MTFSSQILFQQSFKNFNFFADPPPQKKNITVSVLHDLQHKNTFGQQILIFLHTIIGSPESRGFILVALARVSASNWFNIMTRLASFYRK